MRCFCGSENLALGVLVGKWTRTSEGGGVSSTRFNDEALRCMDCGSIYFLSAKVRGQSYPYSDRD